MRLRRALGFANSDAIFAMNLLGAIPTVHGNCVWSQTRCRNNAATCCASPNNERAPVTSRNASSTEICSTNGVMDSKIS